MLAVFYGFNFQVNVTDIVVDCLFNLIIAENDIGLASRNLFGLIKNSLCLLSEFALDVMV